MTLRKSFAAAVLIAGPFMTGMSLALDVNITADLPSVQVLHNGQRVTIMRNQNQDNSINPAFAKTSRKCPPFCIQPIELVPGVRTIGELEMLNYLKKMSDGGKSVLVVDSRTPDSVEKGSIPGAVNIPTDRLDSDKIDPSTVREIMEKQFGAKYRNGSWNFAKARTLVLFCNGPWCGQSPANIKGLLKLGYPAHKLVWYRGGMQDWEAMGLTTVKPGQ
ncbi:MAG: rhodanese-like domain-containing protein [Sulfuricella sp.]